MWRLLFLVRELNYKQDSSSSNERSLDDAHALCWANLFLQEWISLNTRYITVQQLVAQTEPLTTTEHRANNLVTTEPINPNAKCDESTEEHLERTFRKYCG